MGIKSIHIRNLLSFDELQIRSLNEINCLIGKNNSGKSNLLKLLSFFYRQLEGVKQINPELHSNYSTSGLITIEYDTTHINKLVTSYRNRNSSYFNHIYKNLFSNTTAFPFNIPFLDSSNTKNNAYSVSLRVTKKGAIEWSIKNKEALKIIADIFPFFEIDTRHLYLHDWQNIWPMLGKLRPFNANSFKEEIDIFLKENESRIVKKYNQNVDRINSATETAQYDHREKVVNLIKMGLRGQKFEVEGEALNKMSDGTNSFNYIDTIFKILIQLSKGAYVCPTIFVDEPEVGLHPKKVESLINNLYITFSENYSESKTSKKPKPKFFLSTHSPNLVKQVIKKFQDNHNVFHFSKKNSQPTKLALMNSRYSDRSFLGIFSDNEARLFFSSFILFVEGETELEAFSNEKLLSKFLYLNDIDIYQTSSNVLSERINPGYSNTSVPYLFMFDADKAFDIAYPNNGSKIHFKKNGNIFDLKGDTLKRKTSKKYLCGYSSKYRKKSKLATNIAKFDNYSIEIDHLSLSPSKPKSFSPLIKNINSLLEDDRVYILSTTFEGCLICNSSKELFFKWLKVEKGVNIEWLRQRIKQSSIMTEYALIQYLRVIFNGKSNTLAKFKLVNGKKSGSNKYSRWLLKWVESRTIKNSNLKKTDGWVSSFLEFAIAEIDTELEEKKHKKFNTLFNFYFPEFYATLTKLRSVA